MTDHNNIPDQFRPQGLRSYDLEPNAAKQNLNAELEAKTKQDIEREENRAAAERQAKIVAGGIEAELEANMKDQMAAEAKRREEMFATAEERVQTPEEIARNSRIIYRNGVALRVTGSGPDEEPPAAMKAAMELKAEEEALEARKKAKWNEAKASVRMDPEPAPAPAEAPKTDAERIAELEAQVAALTAANKKGKRTYE